MRIRAFITLPLTVLTLTACDQLGLETPAQANARIEADGKAIGGACRHAGRALQDCYEMNRRASKAAIYAGWREMDAYMRENSIAVVAPSGAAPADKQQNATPDEAAENPTDDSGAAKPAAGAHAEEKGGAKTVEKPASSAAGKNGGATAAHQ